MTKFFQFVSLTICSVLLTSYMAFVLMKGWNWLMVPVFDATALTVVSSLILICIIRFLVIPFALTRHALELNKQDEMTFLERFTQFHLIPLSVYSMSLLFFYILKQFI